MSIKLKLSSPLFTLSFLLALAACAAEAAPDGASVVREGELAQTLHGSVIEIAGVDLPKERVHEIAAKVEQMSGAHTAKVALRKEDTRTHLSVEIWSPSPLADGFEDTLRAAFSELAQAEITRADLGIGDPSQAGTGALGTPSFDPHDDAATIEEKVRADMAAQGVEGEVSVKVEDHGEGQREVRVEVEAQGHN